MTAPAAGGQRPGPAPRPRPPSARPPAAQLCPGLQPPAQRVSLSPWPSVTVPHPRVARASFPPWQRCGGAPGSPGPPDDAAGPVVLCGVSPLGVCGAPAPLRGLGAPPSPHTVSGGPFTEASPTATDSFLFCVPLRPRRPGRWELGGHPQSWARGRPPVSAPRAPGGLCAGQAPGAGVAEREGDTHAELQRPRFASGSRGPETGTGGPCLPSCVPGGFWGTWRVTALSWSLSPGRGSTRGREVAPKNNSGGRWRPGREARGD